MRCAQTQAVRLSRHAARGMRRSKCSRRPNQRCNMQSSGRRAAAADSCRMQQRMRRDATRRTARGTAMSAPRRTASAAAACAASAAPAADNDATLATRDNHRDNSDCWRALPPGRRRWRPPPSCGWEPASRSRLPAGADGSASQRLRRADPREAHAQLDARRSHVIGLSAATAQGQPKADREPKWERAK
jgi:hypothetical protein